MRVVLQKHLAEQTGPTYMINLPGMPSESKRGHNCPPSVGAGRALLAGLIAEVKVEAEKENNIIYFQAVPSFEDLPEPPAPAVLMAPTEFVLPPLENGPIVFTYNAARKPSFLTKMASFKVL